MNDPAPPPARGKLRAEPVLGGLALALLLIGCIFIIRPFLTALVWAIILTFCLYPLQKMFTRWFRGSRTLAACLVSLTVTLIVLGPVILIGVSLAQDGKDLANATRKWFLSASDVPPDWMEKVPFAGSELSDYWARFVDGRDRWLEQFDKHVKDSPPRAGMVREEDGMVLFPDDPLFPEMAPAPAQGTTAEAAPATNGEKTDTTSYLAVWFGQLFSWLKVLLLTAGKLVLGGVTEVLLSAFLAFFLLRDAPKLGDRLQVAVQRLAGERGRHLIKVAGDTVRGVIYGIIGTALAQALVAGIGFWIAGVPGAVLLAVLTFIFAIVPFGPPMIWIPASLWLFAQGQNGWGIFMACWGLFGISSVDNVIRPLIICQGSKMPFALIFCGVIGGALAFGLVGVFLGPTLLAVAFRLIEEWSRERVALRENQETDESLLPGAP